jgi:hypothetical protein
MAYTKTNWLPRLGTKLNRYNKSEETATSVVLINAPESITQAGTPYSVENMNKLEEGVYQAHQLIQKRADQDAFGYEVAFQIMPSAQELSDWEMLPLMGQILPIASFQRLFDRKYVGNAANATADWWYKTADPEGTIRDVNGAYMKVLDHQGVFTRPSGANSKYKMANNAPYDGMGIGAHIPDAIQNITGQLGIQGASFYSSTGCFVLDGVSGVTGGTANGGTHWLTFSSALSPNARVAYETRVASISAYLCIKY